MGRKKLIIPPEVQRVIDQAVEKVRAGRTIQEMSIETGIPQHRLSVAVHAAGIPVRRGRRKGGKNPGCAAAMRIVPLEAWEKVDWSMRDNDIAVMLGISRERVRQVRNRMGKPKSSVHKWNKVGIAVRRWLEANRSIAATLTIAQIRDMLPIKAHPASIARVARRCGIEFQKTPRMADIITRENITSFVKVSESGCWEMTIGISQNGYARFGAESAHRLSYRLFYGDIPDGRFVCHHCDNPKCVNPEHLYAGTPADNARDRVERTGFRRLTPEQVLQIREEFSRGKPLQDIAGEAGVAYHTAYSIVTGRTHKTLLAEYAQSA